MNFYVFLILLTFVIVDVRDSIFGIAMRTSNHEHRITKIMSHQSLIITQKSAKDLSKLQKQFNANVKKINDLKQRLEEEGNQLKTIMTKIQAEIIPLERRHNEKIVELVRVFDRHHDDTFFKKKEKEKIADFILNHTEDLIRAGFEELKEVHDKYADETFDEMDAEAEDMTASMMKDMMGSMFGIDFEEDADVSNPQKMQEYIAQKMEEKEAEAEAKKASKKKTAKQIEKEEKIKLEANNISKAARSIYTDLVKAFHPDRERDEDERLRKTEIMKRVTQAYEKDDLFELLRLKIELQGSDIESLTMADEQLKYYNKILKEQVNELEESLWQLRMGASGPMGMMGGGPDLFQKFGGDAKQMKTKFTREINRMKKGIQALETEIMTLTPRENMRRYLKQYQIEEDFDDMDFMNFLPPSFFR
jgi:DNA repair exonuclease SbcCD ATPase subunit